MDNERNNRDKEYDIEDHVGTRYLRYYRISGEDDRHCSAQTYPLTSPEEGFDCDQNTFKITGGTILGIGGGTSTPTSSVCTQRTVIYGGSGSKGTLLSIQGSDQVMSYTIPRAYSQMTLLFSSSKLASGTTYTIYTGGSVTGGTEFYGLTVGGTYTTGSQVATFTPSSMVTSVGNVSSGGPGGGGGGWHW